MFRSTPKSKLSGFAWCKQHEPVIRAYMLYEVNSGIVRAEIFVPGKHGGMWRARLIGGNCSLSYSNANFAARAAEQLVKSEPKIIETQQLEELYGTCENLKGGKR